MNQQQKNYALKRVDEIFELKKREVNSKFSTQRIRIGNKEKYDLIKSGKVKLNHYEKVESRSSYIDNWFDFSKFEKDGGFDEKKGKPTLDKLILESLKVKDRIMLGDSEEAIKLLEEFNNFKI